MKDRKKIIIVHLYRKILQNFAFAFFSVLAILFVIPGIFLVNILMKEPANFIHALLGFGSFLVELCSRFPLQFFFLVALAVILIFLIKFEKKRKGEEKK